VTALLSARPRCTSPSTRASPMAARLGASRTRTGSPPRCEARDRPGIFGDHCLGSIETAPPASTSPKPWEPARCRARPSQRFCRPRWGTLPHPAVTAPIRFFAWIGATTTGPQVVSANNVLARNSKTAPAKSHMEKNRTPFVWEKSPCPFFCGIFLWSFCSDRGMLLYRRAAHEVWNRASMPKQHLTQALKARDERTASLSCPGRQGFRAGCNERLAPAKDG
jgi:hypothetical protein